MAAAEVTGARREIDRGERFAFGDNWARFLADLTSERIAEAERSLQRLLAGVDLRGCRFLDIGSGSGLFSLAARRLGAVVHSFDFDPRSVKCAEVLYDRFFQGDPTWRIEQGSILDAEYVRRLGMFDVVYSWGVLHHTGAMWRAVDHASMTVASGGILVLALYNYQPGLTRFWRGIKRLYHWLPRFLRPALVVPFFFSFALLGLASDLAARRSPLARWRGEGRRGMRVYRDTVDWIGGWPFEVATPAETVEFCRARGFLLERLTTVGGRHGCNEFVFRRLTVVPVGGGLPTAGGSAGPRLP